MKNKKGYSLIEFIIEGFLLFLIIGIIVSCETKEEDNACKELGYNYTNIRNIEKGYFKCCKDIYKEHIKVEKECKAFSRDILDNLSLGEE